MLPVPPAILHLMDVAEGSEVAMQFDRGSLIITPAQPQLDLATLLKECQAKEYKALPKDEAWLNAPSVGKELL